MAVANARLQSDRDEPGEARSRPRAPGILLGIGLGGFVDGIVLHQILQWHHMLTSEGSYPKTTVAGLETNTLWDGLFHAATWGAVLVGIWVLWRRTTAWRWAISGRAFVGWLLVGWGAFNLVEGVVNHHVLAIHHVREGSNETAWDLAFLAFGALLVLGGWLVTSARRAFAVRCGQFRPSRSLASGPPGWPGRSSEIPCDREECDGVSRGSSSP